MRATPHQKLVLLAPICFLPNFFLLMFGNYSIIVLNAMQYNILCNLYTQFAMFYQF